MTQEGNTWEPTAKTQELSKFLYRAPDPKYILPLILLFSILFGLLIDFGAEGLTYGVILLALPAYLSAWSSTRLIDAFGGEFHFRRSILTSFVGVLILGFMLIFGIMISPIIVVHWRFLIIYGYSLVLSMRYLVIRTTVLDYHRYSFIVSSAQTFFAFILHILLSFNDLGYLEDNNFLSLQESSFGILSSLVLFFSSLIFVEIVNSPLKTDVGISGSDLMGYFLSYMNYGTKEIETLFLQLQEEYNIPFSIMAVKRSITMEGKKGNQGASSKPFHALIISPSIHPGPVGTIGGGDLPSKLARPLSDLADHILVPHGAATNDNNPATSEECEKIVRAVRELAESLGDDDFSDIASPLQSRERKTTIHLLRFGNKGMLISEPFPFSSDDITLGIFNNMSWATRYRGIEDIMMIDAHNNSSRESRSVRLGDGISIEMERLVEELCMVEVDQKMFSMGFGSSIPPDPVDGLGPKGVETMVIRARNRTTGLMLFDGNNMLPEIRKAVMEEAEKIVDKAVILTADNHVVNAILGGYNPLGLRCTLEEVIRPMRESMERALEDLGESSVAIKSGLIKGINILGFGNTTRLVATINSTVAVIKRAALACILLAMALSALVCYLV
ncbi:MAG: DUF2070 family protein [Thermoplasmata archaeon]|nr:DUF2070 family protein [Thermoplasmata archaeon]